MLADLAAGGRRPALPGFLSAAAWVDLRQGLTPAGLAALDHALAGIPAGDSGEPLVEPATRIRFMWIPGGRFEMGEKGIAEPVHPVRVTPFWLGETPVTNAQYAVFLEKTGAQEPQYWRDRRFSSPDQPVVGVSWEEAQAFCRWLGEAWRRPVMLPTEAQWEFAARGSEGRKYPWGDEPPPDATRACFGLDWEKGQPAPVGSYPAGRGPLGTLDQAGNVWEWCRDAWAEKAYASRAANAEEPVDPFVEGNEASDRVLRGGGWINPAVSLQAALRLWNPAWYQLDDIGFRVAAAPASS